MKKLLLLSIYLTMSICGSSQTAQFAWMAGSTFSNSVGSWGTKGVSSSTNAVSSREEAISWTDNNGNFWIFGGNGIASTSNLGRLSDLWKYNVSLNEWTWVSGTSLMNQNGIYGTKGVASTTITPGGRYQSTSWVDNSGNLWLFGGYGNDASGGVGYLNDLWKFNPSTTEWTWVAGTNSVSVLGSYGILGVSTTTNMPGARSRPVSWVDNTGNFWMLGGYGFATTATAGNLSDLWKFDPTTAQWTWMAGTNGINAASVYGTKGVASTSNRPGSRGLSASFKDNTGNLWLFGGNGIATGPGIGKLNDLWKFNPATLEWTWVGGSNALAQGNTYGTKGTPAAVNIPSGRDRMVAWTDNSGNFWLLGGHGKDAANGFDNELNDLWMYHVTNNTWTYVAGSTAALQSGIYGTQGVLSSTNVVGSRQKAVSFKDNNGDLWLFGGYGKPSVGTGYLSDWWKIKTCYTSLAASTTASTNLVICSGANTGLSASGVGNLGWYSAIIGGSYLGGGSNYTTPTLTTNTTYYVQDSTCGSGPRVAITVTVNALPTLTITGTNAMCIGNTATMSVVGASTYTWSNAENTTSISVTPTITTMYVVSGTDANGCLNTKSKTVTVNALPTLTITGGTTMCKGQTTFLSASGANSYTWSTGQTVGNISASPTVTTIYTVTGRNTTTGCVNTQTTMIAIQTPTAYIAGNYSVCTGGSTTFTASGASTYTWTSGMIMPVYSATATIYPSTNFNYSLTAKDALGCTITKTFVVTPLANPTVGIVLPTQQCAGTTITLTASGASSYTWLPGNFIGNMMAVSPTINTSYSVIGTAANTCTNTTSAIVSVKPNPSISITASQNVICEGATVSLYGNGSTSNGYVWSTGQTTSSITSSPSVTTTYTLTGTGTNGCSAEAIKTVTVNAKPPLQVATTETLLCAGQTATLTATGANTYTWNTGSNSSELLISPTTTSNYTVTGTASNGCSNATVFTQNVSVCTGIATIQNESLYSVFPNPTNGELIVEVEQDIVCEIYNAVGQIVFRHSLEQGKTTIDLLNQPSGIYFVQLKKQDSVKTIKIMKQ